MRIFLLVVLSFIVLTACTQKPIASESTPTLEIKDFTIPPELIGDDFEPRALDGEAEAMQFNENPGLVLNKDYHSYEIDGEDGNLLKNMFAHIIVKPERPRSELGIIAMEFVTEAAFSDHLERVSKRLLQQPNGNSYLHKYPFIVSVFSDTNSYEENRKQLKNYYITEFGMEVVE